MYDLLKGIRIIDFSHVWQGPVATLMLADLGADVIKVERPGRGDWSRAWGPFVEGMSLPFAGLNRGKRSIVLDLKSDAGMQALDRLLETADAVVHNFRPGVDTKMGIDFPTLHARFPKLVHASASGWGEHGADAERGRAGHAQMAAAEGGLFSAPTESQLPRTPTISVDHVAGLILCNAILAGLMARGRTGLGIQVFTDLHSAALSTHVWDGPSALNSSSDSGADLNLSLTEKTLPHAWKTADGYIEISPVFSEKPVQLICEGLGLPDLTQKIEFGTTQLQYQNRDALRGHIASRLAERKTSEWLQTLEARGILCAEIRSPDEALNADQAKANGMIIEVENDDTVSLKLIGSPIRTNQRPGLSRFPPQQGEHTSEILREIGLGLKQ